MSDIFWSAVLAVTLIVLSACIWFVATGDVDNVQVMGQMDYERMTCVGSGLPECKSYQVAGQ